MFGPGRLLGAAVSAATLVLGLATLTAPAGGGTGRGNPAAPTLAPVTGAAPAAAGALFVPGSGAALRPGLAHSCSGSVVHSPGHDLVLTAAHCVAGTGAGYQFVPAYRAGQAPFGVWDVQRVYLNQAWLAHQDPQHDYAFLQTAPQQGHQIEDLVAAPVLGTAPAAGIPVTVVGYTDGVNDTALRCTAAVYQTAGYPTIACPGFGDGTSGAAWTDGDVLVALIGGLQQGGCSPDVSYSPPFGAAIATDWRRAAAGGPGDVAPVAASSACLGSR